MGLDKAVVINDSKSLCLPPRRARGIWHRQKGRRLHMRHCAAITRKGNNCKGIAVTNSEWCHAHHPQRATQRQKAASIAARSRHTRIGKELQSVKELSYDVVLLTLRNDLPFGVNTYLKEIVRLLECYIKSCELQIRLGEKPFMETPDVSALRVEVLQRIEELEQAELEQAETIRKSQRWHKSTTCR